MNTRIKQFVDGQRDTLILKGDCRDLARDLPEGIADACICDPPYGIRWCGKENKQKAIANDATAFIWFLDDAFRILKDTATLACFCSWRTQEDFRRSIEIAGFKIRSHVIWDRKRRAMATHTNFAMQHDVIWFATKGRFRFPNGVPASVLSHTNIPPTQRLHTTEKPAGLMQDLVRYLTPDDGVVYDPCMGSGSTGDAALATGRRFIGLELDQDNFNIARTRLRSHDPKACLATPPHAFVEEDLHVAA